MSNFPKHFVAVRQAYGSDYFLIRFDRLTAWQAVRLLRKWEDDPGKWLSSGKMLDAVKKIRRAIDKEIADDDGIPS